MKAAKKEVQYEKDEMRYLGNIHDKYISLCIGRLPQRTLHALISKVDSYLAIKNRDAEYSESTTNQMNLQKWTYKMKILVLLLIPAMLIACSASLQNKDKGVKKSKKVMVDHIVDQDGRLYEIKDGLIGPMKTAVEGSYCPYGIEKFCDEHGALYTAKAALNACPKGTKLPNEFTKKIAEKQNISGFSSYGPGYNEGSTKSITEHYSKNVEYKLRFRDTGFWHITGTIGKKTVSIAAGSRRTFDRSFEVDSLLNTKKSRNLRLFCFL